MESLQFHVLSFEGPDPYSQAGGLATRIEGLTETIASLGYETHLWFIGDPDLPGHETLGSLHLHRWAQWVSRHHPGGVYAGESDKQSEFATSLPPYLFREVLLPHLERGGRGVVLAEEWQTADTVLHLNWLLRRSGRRNQTTVLWNANNTFGFERIRWDRLRESAVITTVSRYMKHQMKSDGIDALVIPNGLASDAFDPPNRAAVGELRRRFRERTLLTKMARWDPDKRWLAAIGLVAEMKRQGLRPLLVARGGSEPHGQEVLRAVRTHGLQLVERRLTEPGVHGMLEGLSKLGHVDIVNLRSHVDPTSRRMLFRGAEAVLANSGHEPFGLVGLETMAVGGLACTGCSGEDYAQPGQNAIVLETDNPHEFLGHFSRLRTHPKEARALRQAGRATARRYAWRGIVERVLLPRLDVLTSPSIMQ